MNSSLTVSRRFRMQRKRHGRMALRGDIDDPKPSSERVPRVARLMALAIHFDQLLRDGVVADQAELARFGHVSRARLTQILNLLSLAPEIQEALLYPPVEARGRPTISERHLRPIATLLDWKSQRQAWSELAKSHRSTAVRE